jgi:hypothetical protein
VISLATGTGTRRNLDAMRAHGFGLLLTPDRPEMRNGFDLFAIDNGAWGCFQRGVQWLPEPWQRLVEAHGRTALFAILPDVVCGGAASLALSLSWLPWAQERCPQVLIAVQNGMTAEDLRPHVGPHVGIFVGGDTEWKEGSLPMWGALAKETGCWLHVGRVNSARRIRLCALSGVHSFDGTSATRFAVTTPVIDMARRQTAMEFFT